MSQEGLDVVRRHIEAYGREDVSGALSFLDPFVVWDPSRVGPADAKAAFGHEAVAEAIARYVGAFKDYVYEVDRLTDLGSGAILAVATEAGRGKGSDAPVRRSLALLYTVLEGKITRMTVFASEEQALEAADLNE